MKYIVWAIAFDNFCLHFCNWQLFYALLQLLTFKCTFTIANILWNMANEIYCMSNCIWELLYALLYFNVFMYHQIDIFCMHNWIWYLFARLESTNFYVLLLLKTCVYIITIANFICANSIHNLHALLLLTFIFIWVIDNFSSNYFICIIADDS